MTDLDNTQIITADESLLQNSSTIDTEASLKIISGTDSNTYQLGKETIIGRSNPSDLIISAPSLSKQHAKITFNNGQYFITDLGSSNKTFHNKIQLQPNVCYALHHGDEIKLGDIICSFEEQTQSNKNTFSEPTYESYVPVVNTLVEEDSPWPLDDDILPPVIPETNADVIPSTQTISDSYDDEEPTQPMKIWNGHSHNTNRLSRTSIKSSEDVTLKQNGLNNSPSHKSSAFIPISISNHEHDDGNLMIGGTTLPATVPIVIESTQLNDDDQLEIISSSQTKKINEEGTNAITVETVTTTTTTTTTTEADIGDTQAYTLEPTGEIISSNCEIAETQPYDLESEQIVTDIIETKREEVHQLVITGDTMMEQITTTTTTTTVTENDNLPVDTLAYDLQPTRDETTTTVTTKTTTTVVENENPPMETLAYDLQPTNEQMDIDASAPAVCSDTQEYSLDEEINGLSPRPASETLEVVPVSKLVERLQEVENLTDDATPKQQVEITIDPDVGREVAADAQMDTEQTELPSPIVNEKTETPSINRQPHELTPSIYSNTTTADETNTDAQSTITEQETPVDLNKSFTATPGESEQVGESTPTDTLEDVPLTIADDEENQLEGEEGEEETEGSIPISGRGQRGVPRRAARRARGRRGGGGASRARIVSTRIHGVRRNAGLPSAVDDDGNNATLEETVNTEAEESPRKSLKTSDVEKKPLETQATIPMPTDTTTESNQTNSASNVRVSARIKARASSGRNRQFPYTDDYVDLDDLEKQTKTSNTPPTSTTATTGRKSTRGGRSSSAPQKRISLRQQPIDASESPEEKTIKQKDTTNIYEQMDTGGENEEPDLSTKTVGRKRKSTTPVAPTTTKRTRSATPQSAPVINTREKQTSNVDSASPSNTVTPKRGRKPTKTTTPTEPSLEEQTPATDRPVRIALSSHLNFDQNHLATLRKLGFEIMDESCHVDALVVDRIRRTKKFFMCLARGAHILSPTWIDAMIKENRYIPYDKYYLDDNNAETRYGFQLRESVRLAKQHPIFENYKIFCTKDTSPPYDDLKDIVEAAGGKFIEKINMSKPGKDLICIVAQIHKNEYEDLFKKGVPIVSEEFALSGISKQKLDFESFSLFQNAAATVKPTGSK